MVEFEDNRLNELTRETEMDFVLPTEFVQDSPNVFAENSVNRQCDEASPLERNCSQAKGARFEKLPESSAWTYFAMHDANTAVLAFDIETTGLDSDICDVTCACAYDPTRGIERSFVFARGDNQVEFLALLDEAPLLCAFNGVRFDLPFLAKKWGVPNERVGAWVRKLVDPFEACKLALGRTFSLNKLLSLNGLQVKTSSGMAAVIMAKEGRWDELVDYCMHDTKMTHAAVTMPRLLIPQDVQRQFKRKPGQRYS